MFARLTVYENIDLVLADQVKQWMESLDAEEASALVAALYGRARPDVPEALRPALDKQPDSVGLYEVVHRD